MLAIKQTIYRTGADSTMVESLVKAAEEGEQVVALVELEARFDEADVRLGQSPGEGSIHVVYGLVGLKNATPKVVLLVVVCN